MLTETQNEQSYIGVIRRGKSGTQSPLSWHKERKVDGVIRRSGDIFLANSQ